MAHVYLGYNTHFNCLCNTMLLWTPGTPLPDPAKVDFDLRRFPKPYVLFFTRVESVLGPDAVMKTVEPRLRYTRGREEAFLVSGFTQGRDCRKGNPGEGH